MTVEPVKKKKDKLFAIVKIEELSNKVETFNELFEKMEETLDKADVQQKELQARLESMGARIVKEKRPKKQEQEVQE